MTGDQAADAPAAADPASPADPVPAEADRPSTGRSRSRLWFALGGVLLLVGALAIAGLVVAGRDDGGYTEETQQAFMDACTAEGGSDVAPTCSCLYEAIEAEVAYERFEEVNDLLVAGRDADPDTGVELPDDFEALLEDCRKEVAFGEAER